MPKQKHMKNLPSKYYAGFVKFGRKMVNEELLEPENYAEYLIRESVKLSD